LILTYTDEQLNIDIHIRTTC